MDKRLLAAALLGGLALGPSAPPVSTGLVTGRGQKIDDTHRPRGVRYIKQERLPRHFRLLRNRMRAK